MLSAPPKAGPDGLVQLHASTVVIKGRAVAITGPAGVGKSGFAFGLMARGAQLLADDVTWLRGVDGAVTASCPPALSGRIEARGIGTLNAPPADPAPLTLIVDLGAPERERLPPLRTLEVCGQQIRLLHKPETSSFLDAVWHYMMHHQGVGN